MPSTRVVVLREVTQPLADKDTLCLQEVLYNYDGKPENFDHGFRFIRRTPEGKMKAQRGQANCFSLAMIQHLVRIFESSFGVKVT